MLHQASLQPKPKPVTVATTVSKVGAPKAKALALPAPAVNPLPLRAVVFETGSLREQVQAVAKAWGWPHVVWQLPGDYQWHGHVVMRANDLQGLCRQLLADYPIQAVFYEGNHVLLFRSRRLI